MVYKIKSIIERRPFKVGGKKSAEIMAAEVEALLGGHKPDICIECSGIESSIRLSDFFCENRPIKIRFLITDSFSLFLSVRSRLANAFRLKIDETEFMCD